MLPGKIFSNGGKLTKVSPGEEYLVHVNGSKIGVGLTLIYSNPLLMVVTYTHQSVNVLIMNLPFYYVHVHTHTHSV